MLRYTRKYKILLKNEVLLEDKPRQAHQIINARIHRVTEKIRIKD